MVDKAPIKADGGKKKKRVSKSYSDFRHLLIMNRAAARSTRRRLRLKRP